MRAKGALGWVAIGCALASSGCASVDRRLQGATDVQATVSDSFTPGRVQGANVGDLVVRVRDYRKDTAPAKYVRANVDFTLAGGLDRIRFTEGEKLHVVGRRRGPDGKPWLVVAKEDDYLLLVDDEGHVSSHISTDIGFGRRTPVLPPFHPHPANGRLVPERKHEVEEATFGDNYDLLFSGVSAGALNLTLREYWRDDLDRPAVGQTLVFPLDGHAIHFRKLTIEVRKAEPGRLEYVVNPRP